MGGEVGFLSKGCCSHIPANDRDPTSVHKEKEAAGRAGEIWRWRQGEGCPRCRDRPCVFLYPDHSSHLVFSTCAQVTSDSSQ